jgi:hypothetical protein
MGTYKMGGTNTLGFFPWRRSLKIQIEIITSCVIHNGPAINLISTIAIS